MSQAAPPCWIIERQVARGEVRIGLVGRRLVAELNLRRIALTGNDIATIQEVASSRHTAHLFPTLRDGGYTHLLGGAVALLPGEARILKEVVNATPEGLVIHRVKLVEALEKEPPEDTDVDDVITGLAQHGDERALRITPARGALNAFDAAHPQVLAGLNVRQE